MVIMIGTCGWSRLYQALPPSERKGKTNLQSYAERYPTVEVNSSFYRFHRTATYRRWREEAPPGFEFTVKCHQSISHEERLRPTERAMEGFGRMVEGAGALGSSVLLIQTPGSLTADSGVLGDADVFFEEADAELTLAWETRGESWEEEGARDGLFRVLRKHGVVHVTDPLKLSPVFHTDVAYFRLHGLPGYNLRYTYTNNELAKLYDLLRAFEREAERVYAFFNNYAMYEDAGRLLTLHRSGRLPPSPFGPRSVKRALTPYEGWPAAKKRLLDDCGRWRCWVAPDRSVRLSTILERFDEGEYEDLEEAGEEAERIWVETGYPTAEEVESGRKGASM